MQEIGITLKNAREKKKLTLIQVQEVTKIRLRFLEAIEAGNLDIIPGEVYRKGFISNYATAVGLDSEAILREYQQLKALELPAEKRPPEKKVVEKKSIDPKAVEKKRIEQKAVEKKSIEQKAAEKKSIEPKTVEPKNEAKKAVPLKAVKAAEPAPIPSKPRPEPVNRSRTNTGTASSPNLKQAIAGIVFIMVGISVFLILKNNSSKTAILQAKSNSVPQSVAAPGKNLKAGRQTVKRNVTTVQQLYPAPLTVYAEFSQDVWIQLKVDGKMRFLDNGVTFTTKSPKQLWTANSEMIIRVGNPAGIKLTLNGKDLGVLGATNVAKTFILTAGGMEESQEENWQRGEDTP